VPLSAVLKNLCDGIDTQDPQMMSTVLLMDPGGDQLRPAVGRRVSSGWTRAITPLPVTASTMALRTANLADCDGIFGLKARAHSLDKQQWRRSWPPFYPT
jgi:hypothetical protein